MNVRGAGDWELQLRDDQGETIDYTLDGTIRERLDLCPQVPGKHAHEVVVPQ